jgi:hypothetical protein
MNRIIAKPTLYEADQIRLHVEELIRSTQFKNSKRYPRFLSQIVTCTLAGNTEELKERTLGHTVFDRALDYDTSEDPIVRITAGEVRKRLALYYQEHQDHHSVHIGLPVGGYVAEFSYPSIEVTPVQEVTSPTADAPLEESDSTESSLTDPGLGTSNSGEPPEAAIARHSPLSMMSVALISSVLSLFVFVMGYVAFRAFKNSKLQAIHSFWAPMTEGEGPAQFIVGRTTLVLPIDSQPSLEASLLGIRTKIALSDAQAFSRICSQVRTEDRNCSMAISNLVSITDLRRSPIVTIGLFNNEWSTRLLQNQRFRPNHNVDAQGITHEAWITDEKDPKARWGLDFGERLDAISKDYGILARFDSSLTGKAVTVVGGLSSLATEGVGEFATDPQLMETLQALNPDRRSRHNVEAVIETQVINGKPGRSRVVAAEFW